MRKRANGEGSFRTRADGTWEAQIRHNYKRYSVYGKTRKECADKLKELKRKLDFGIVKDKTMTFEKWLTHWLENIVSIRNKPSTYDNYKVIANAHIVPVLGRIPIDKLTKADIQALVKKEVSKGKSASTVSLVHHVCRVSLNDAIDSNLILFNPALGVAKPKKVKKEMKVLSKEQFQALKISADEIREKERMFSCFLFMIYTGLRRGETLGLKWSDIDFNAKNLTMNRSVTCTRSKGVVINRGKTVASARTIPIPENAIKELLIFKERQATEKAFYGKKYKDEKWIFCRPDGKRYYPASLRRMWLRILELAGVPVIRVHDTRHTFATLLLLAGENPKTVQEMLGHTNISTTLGSYSHVTSGLKRQAADKLDEI